MDKYTTKNLKYVSLRKAFISPPGISYPILDGYMQVPSQLVLEPEGNLLQDIMYKMRDRRKSLASDIKFMFMTNWRPVGVRHPLPPHDIVKVQGAESVDNSTFTKLNNNLIWVIERGHKVGYIRIIENSALVLNDDYTPQKEYCIIIGAKNIYRSRSDSRCYYNEIVVTAKGKGWMARVIKQIDTHLCASAEELIGNIKEAMNTGKEAFSSLKNGGLYEEINYGLSDRAGEQIEKNYSKISNSIPLARNCFTARDLRSNPKNIINLLMYMLFKQHEEVSWDSMPSTVDVDYIELINDIALSTPSETRKEFIDKLESASTSYIIQKEHLNIYEAKAKTAKLHINLLGNVTLFIPWLVNIYLDDVSNSPVSPRYRVFHFDNMSLLPKSLRDGVDIMQTTGLCEYVQNVGMMFASYDKCEDAEFEEEAEGKASIDRYFEAFTDFQRARQEDYGSYFSFDKVFFRNAVEDNLDWFESLPDEDNKE